jgi:hypothetical protein
LQHKNAKVVQGSSHDVVGAVEILLLSYGQIDDNNNFYIQLARNLRKEINIKTIQRNYDGRRECL